MLDKRTSSILFTIMCFVGGLAFVYATRRPILILIFSIFFAYLLEPMVAWFQRRFRDSRTSGIIATYLILTVAVWSGIGSAGPRIVQQSTKLAHELPNLIEKFDSGDIAQQIGSQQGWTYDTKLRLQELLGALRPHIGAVVQNAAAQVPEMAKDLLWFLLIPILAIFVLESKTEFMSAAMALVDSRYDRQFVRSILGDLDVMFAVFIRAQLSLAALSILAYTLVLVLASFPYAFPIAAIAGVLEFIPVVGPLTGFMMIMGISIVSGYPHWLAILIFLIVWRILQDYVTSPLLMGRGLRLHPFAVILGILFCGEVAGLPGVFLSIPLMASLRIVSKNWEKRRIAKDGVRSEGTDYGPHVT
jgi:predicted PurR-regulated permease PerM